MEHETSKVAFVGSALLGERGQVVIPAEARRELGMNPGDRLLVLVPPGREAVVLTKVETIQRAIEAFLSTLSEFASSGKGDEEDAESDV